METFYRAKIVLEEVRPFRDDKGYDRQDTSEIASITVTAGHPGNAIDQAANHVNTLSHFHRPPTAEADGR